MYLDANLAVLEGRIAFDLDPLSRAGFLVAADGKRSGDESLVDGVEVVGPAWIGRGARIAPGTRVERAIVGEGAEVRGDLRESVVWDGARLPPGEHHRVIAHDGGLHQVT